jgi:chorismate lyase
VRIIPVFPRQRQHWLRQPVGSGPYRSWLIETASLTQRLQSRSAAFAVNTLSLRQALPAREEAALLGIPSRRPSLMREVHLLCNSQPAVYASSVLPLSSLRGVWRGLGRLGNRSLGSMLFSNPRVSRAPLSYRKLTSQHRLYRQAVAHLQNKPDFVWARRSVFHLDCVAILVTEVFLPPVLRL